MVLDTCTENDNIAISKATALICWLSMLPFSERAFLRGEAKEEEDSYPGSPRRFLRLAFLSSSSLRSLSSSCRSLSLSSSSLAKSYDR